MILGNFICGSVDFMRRLFRVSDRDTVKCYTLHIEEEIEVPIVYCHWAVGYQSPKSGNTVWSGMFAPFVNFKLHAQ
jgi:hypothetical protein